MKSVFDIFKFIIIINTILIPVRPFIASEKMRRFTCGFFTCYTAGCQDQQYDQKLFQKPANLWQCNLLTSLI